MTIKEKKRLADETAKTKGFEFASYVGDHEDAAIYLGAFKEVTATGLPLWIEVYDDGTVNTDFGFKYMDLVKEE